MLHLTTITKEDVLLKKDEIFLIKSYGKEKTSIHVKGVAEPLIVMASFTQVQFAITNNLSAVAISEPPVKLAQVTS